MRISEWVIAVYFGYALLLSLLLPYVSNEVRWQIAGATALVVIAYVWLRRREARHHAAWSEMARDWLPLPVALLAYKEMGWMAPPAHDYHLEQSWMQLDRLLLGTWGGHAAIEVFSPVLPAFLDACYVLVYALPFFVVGVVYKFRRRKQIDEVLTIYLLGLFLAYAQFPFWPSEPPRAVFPFELVPTVTAVRRFNLWLLGSYGIHTSVFPSAHVSGAFAAAAAVWRILPDIAWIRWSTLTYAILIAISTVYGRYHYAADAFAGMAVALAAFLLAEVLHGRRTSRSSPSHPAEAERIGR